MPFFFFGPSNQIHQAKEAIYAMRKDYPSAEEQGPNSFTLMLPPMLQHYSQSPADDTVPFSEHFDFESEFVIEERNAFGDPVSRKADAMSILDRTRVWLRRLTVACKVASGDLLTSLHIPEECPVYHHWSLTGRLLERCVAQAEQLHTRHGGQLCRTFAYLPFRGSLRDLAGAMRANQTGFALSCFLGPQMSTKLIVDQVKGSNSKTTARNDVQQWFKTADILRLRVSTAQPLPMLTLHLRAPDNVILRRKRVTTNDFVIGKDPKNNAVVPRQNLTDSILVVLGKAEERHRVTIRTIHVMTNDRVLASFLHKHFQGRGYSVTFSPDRSIAALMRDYKLATQSVAFCGMRKSSITTNIEQARLELLGQDGVSGDQFWEDIIPEANY